MGLIKGLLIGGAITLKFSAHGKSLYYYTILYNKTYFSDCLFLYSLCPNLEGINNVLCYKFRRPTIGQNRSAVCINKSGHRDAFLNERRVSRGLLSRPPSLAVLRHSLVVDST